MFLLWLHTEIGWTEGILPSFQQFETSMRENQKLDLTQDLSPIWWLDDSSSILLVLLLKFRAIWKFEYAENNEARKHDFMSTVVSQHIFIHGLMHKNMQLHYSRFSAGTRLVEWISPFKMKVGLVECLTGCGPGCLTIAAYQWKLEKSSTLLLNLLSMIKWRLQ